LQNQLLQEREAKQEALDEINALQQQFEQLRHHLGAYKSHQENSPSSHEDVKTLILYSEQKILQKMEDQYNDLRNLLKTSSGS
jgi:hypothetical protein